VEQVVADMTSGPFQEEIFRDLGVEDQVLADATPHELVGDTVFCTSIAGEEIGRIRTWGTHPAREADYQLASPCLVCDIPRSAHRRRLHHPVEVPHRR
jgi:FAD binding domain